MGGGVRGGLEEAGKVWWEQTVDVGGRLSANEAAERAGLVLKCINLIIFTLIAELYSFF